MMEEYSEARRRVRWVGQDSAGHADAGRGLAMPGLHGVGSLLNNVCMGAEARATSLPSELCSMQGAVAAAPRPRADAGAGAEAVGGGGVRYQGHAAVHRLGAWEVRF